MRIPCSTLKPATIVMACVTILGACSSTPPPSRPVPPPITSDAAGETLVGKVIWHDLLTHDAGAALEFYGGLFGWDFEESEEAPGRYWDITREGQAIGSVFAANADELDSPLWLVSLSVPDVDGSVSKAGGLGASVAVPPSDLPNRGRYAVLEDPQGAFFVVLRSTSGDPRDTQHHDPGEWLWTELWTTDARGAVDFYEGLLGYRSEGIAARLEEVAEDEYGEAIAEGDLPVVFYAMSVGEDVRAGSHQLPAEAHPHWLPYVAVGDVAEAVARAVELGASVLLPAEAVNNGEAAILSDPTGAPFGVQQWPRPGGGDR